MSKVLDSLVHDEQEQEQQADLKELLKGAQQSVSALGFLKQLHNIHKNSHRLDQNVLNKALRHLRLNPPAALFDERLLASANRSGHALMQAIGNDIDLTHFLASHKIYVEGWNLSPNSTLADVKHHLLEQLLNTNTNTGFMRFLATAQNQCRPIDYANADAKTTSGLWRALSDLPHDHNGMRAKILHLMDQQNLAAQLATAAIAAITVHFADTHEMDLFEVDNCLLAIVNYACSGWDYKPESSLARPPTTTGASAPSAGLPPAKFSLPNVGLNVTKRVHDILYRTVGELQLVYNDANELKGNACKQVYERVSTLITEHALRIVPPVYSVFQSAVRGAGVLGFRLSNMVAQVLTMIPLGPVFALATDGIDIATLADELSITEQNLRVFIHAVAQASVLATTGSGAAVTRRAVQTMSNEELIAVVKAGRRFSHGAALWLATRHVRAVLTLPLPKQPRYKSTSEYNDDDDDDDDDGGGESSTWRAGALASAKALLATLTNSDAAQRIVALLNGAPRAVDALVRFVTRDAVALIVRSGDSPARTKAASDLIALLADATFAARALEVLVLVLDNDGDGCIDDALQRVVPRNGPATTDWFRATLAAVVERGAAGVEHIDTPVPTMLVDDLDSPLAATDPHPMSDDDDDADDGVIQIFVYHFRSKKEERYDE
jgi:hypothetical protein